jgi:hypothetical protein
LGGAAPIGAGFGGGEEAGRAGVALPEGMEPPTLDVLRHDFIVQIVWQPNSITERLKAREEKAKAEATEEELQSGDSVAAAP